MEIKKIYIDLKEATKEQRRGKDVWVLESEAFKEPITFEIGYTDHEMEQIRASKESVEEQVMEAQRMFEKINNKEQERKSLISDYKEELKVKDDTIESLTKKLEKSEKEKIKILKEVEGIRAIMFSHNEQLDHHTDEIDKIKKKIMKEPRVYSGQTFISGNGISALTALRVQDGNYAVIWMVKTIEKNEYVENDDVEVGAFNIHVDDGIWTPEYDLKGTTELDTPTASINWTFILIPC